MGKFLPNPKLKLREQLHEVMRFRHFSHRTESAYWHWIKGFIQFHRKRTPDSSTGGERGAWRHPREMQAPEVQAYLSHLATDKNVAAATQRQAFKLVEG